jgi:hypothetical protein
MEMENHESLGHQLHSFLAEGDFCWTGGGGGGEKMQKIEKLFPVDRSTRIKSEGSQKSRKIKIRIK